MSDRKIVTSIDLGKKKNRFWSFEEIFNNRSRVQDTYMKSSFLVLSRRLISGLESSLCLSRHFSTFFLMPSMSLWRISGLFEGLVAWSSPQTFGSSGRERGLVRGGGDPLPSCFSRLLDLGADWPLTGSNCCCRLGLSSTLCCLFNSFFVRLLRYGIITKLDWHRNNDWHRIVYLI